MFELYTIQFHEIQMAEGTKILQKSLIQVEALLVVEVDEDDHQHLGVEMDTKKG